MVFTDTTFEERDLLLPSRDECLRSQLGFCGRGNAEPLLVPSAFFSKSLKLIFYILSRVLTILNRKSRGKYGYFCGDEALLLDAALISSQGLQLTMTFHNEIKPHFKRTVSPTQLSSIIPKSSKH